MTEKSKKEVTLGTPTNCKEERVDTGRTIVLGYLFGEKF